MKKQIFLIFISFVLLTTIVFSSTNRHLILADKSNDTKDSDNSGKNVDHLDSRHHHQDGGLHHSHHIDHSGSHIPGSPTKAGGASAGGVIPSDNTGGHTHRDNIRSTHVDKQEKPISTDSTINPHNGYVDLHRPCINVYLPVQLGGVTVNCLNLNKETTILNSINPIVTLKPFSGGSCSLGDYLVKDVHGSTTYCLESNK
jgi:hypothetical protein